MALLSFGGRENCEAVRVWVIFFPHGLVLFFSLKEKIYPLGYKKKSLMDWQYLRKGRGQDFQSFIKDFRKQALNLGIALDSPEVVTKYIGSLRSYLRHSLLLFEPTTVDSASVKAIHIENMGKMKEMIISRNHISNLQMENPK